MVWTANSMKNVAHDTGANRPSSIRDTVRGIDQIQTRRIDSQADEFRHR